MSRWARYWGAAGGRTGVAVVRVGIAAAVLWTLYRLATLSTVQLPAPAEIYRPVGVWMLTGYWVPPAAVVSVVWVIAWAATGLMLVGLWARVTTAVAFVAAVALASLSFSGVATWSHQYNVVFLAHAAFLGARCGDALSLDALIRRWRREAPVDVPGGYQWSLRLVQLAVALMFSGAVFHKVLHGHGTLRWALTDNLRNHLLVRYDLAGLPRPALVDWLIDDVWRYRTAAVLNMLSQATPILAVIFVRRPWVRLLGAAAFVVETLALGFVVSLWNLHWLPLVVVFVDWDWVLGRRAPDEPRRLRRGPRIYIVAFFVYELVTSFIPTVDQRLNTYPFSSFPMFATIRANPPYDEHRAYALAGDRYVVTADRPLTPDEQRWLDHDHRWLFNAATRDELKARLTALLAAARARWPELHVRAIRHYLAIYDAPAYPAPARFDVHPIAITGELDARGAFRSYLGAWDGKTPLAAYADDALAPQPVTSPDPAKVAGDPVYIVTQVDGEAWLVVQRGAMRATY